MAAARSARDNAKVAKSGDTKNLMIAAAVLTLVAGVGGWFLGAQISDMIVPAAPKAENTENSEKAAVDTILSNNNVTVLPPILANLASPSTSWIRVEVALVAKPEEKISSELATEISNDFLALLRECTISQVRGPTGLMYLREDLLERAKTRSEGKVSHILIFSLVIE